MQPAEIYKYQRQNHCLGFEMITFVVMLISTTMNAGRSVFRQILNRLNQRHFDRISSKYDSRLNGCAISPRNHLLMILYGQLDGCRSIRELNDAITAHKVKCKHHRVTSFWGQSENAERIQVYVAIITYCLICIIRQQNGCARNPYEVFRTLGSFLLVKNNMADLLAGKMNEDQSEDLQLRLDFGS